MYKDINAFTAASVRVQPHRRVPLTIDMADASDLVTRFLTPDAVDAGRRPPVKYIALLQHQPCPGGARRTGQRPLLPALPTDAMPDHGHPQPAAARRGHRAAFPARPRRRVSKTRITLTGFARRGSFSSVSAWPCSNSTRCDRQHPAPATPTAAVVPCPEPGPRRPARPPSSVWSIALPPAEIIRSRCTAVSLGTACDVSRHRSHSVVHNTRVWDRSVATHRVERRPKVFELSHQVWTPPGLDVVQRVP